MPAIEESIFAGVPINVTLLFSREQYLAAADAYLRGIERRIAAGLRPGGRLGRVAVRQPLGQGGRRQGAGRAAQRPRHRRRAAHLPRLSRAAGIRALAAARRRRRAPQRLLWASTGTKDPAAPDTLYVEALAAPDTINTMPEKTLLAFADHGNVDGAMAADGGDAEAVLAKFARGRHRHRRAGRRSCSRKAPTSFVKSWKELLQRIDDKSAAT